MSAAPTERPAAEIARSVQGRETTAAEVVDAYLARIAALDERVHAFATVTADDARAAARAVDAAVARGDAGPLAGVPVAVKDLIAVRGVARGNGSVAFAGATAETADAPVVARLRAA